MDGRERQDSQPRIGAFAMAAAIGNSGGGLLGLKSVVLRDTKQRLAVTTRKASHV